MATAKKPPDTLAASLGQQQKRIDEMRASARMRARFMRKIPKPVEFPRRSVDVRNVGPPGRTLILSGSTAAAIHLRTGADVSEEPPLLPADNQNRG
jgi:hypothetical protein